MLKNTYRDRQIKMFVIEWQRLGVHLQKSHIGLPDILRRYIYPGNSDPVNLFEKLDKIRPAAATHLKNLFPIEP